MSVVTPIQTSFNGGEISPRMGGRVDTAIYPIALEVCETLTQSAAKKQGIASEYQKFMGDARLVDAIEEGREDPPDDDFITVRA